jgi:hypothetical protein
MLRSVAVFFTTVVLLTPIFGCQSRHKTTTFNPALSGSFFPLETNSIWTYRINSKSQRSTYIVTDKVVGEKYVPSLNVTGEVVEEYYNMDRGGTRPIVYIVKNGYLNRLSGLEYAKQEEIQAPAWGRSEDGAFLPARLTPELSWNSKILPFGHLDGAFDINQAHRSVFETEDVVVPAGTFSGCIRIDTDAVYEGGSYAKSAKKMQLAYRDWYAPNVGLVRTVALEGGPSGPEMERVELIKYARSAAPLPRSAAGASPAAGAPQAK